MQALKKIKQYYWHLVHSMNLTSQIIRKVADP